MNKTSRSPFKNTKQVVAFIFFLCLIPCTALAADPDNQGRGFIEPKVYMMGAVGNSNITSPIYNYGAEFGFFATNNIDLGVELLGVYFQQHQHNPGNLANIGGLYSALYGTPVSPGTNTTAGTDGVGGNAVANWHFFQTDKGSGFVGVGLGYFGFSNITPINGTSQTALAENVDLGFTANITDNVFLKMTGRYQHFGEYSDKGLDTLGGSLGFTFMF